MSPYVTAVVLSARPYKREFEGIEVLPYLSVITDAAELQAARFNALTRVRTPYFFFLDDDDDLPDDYLAVLERCFLADTALAYTDELVRLADGEESVRRSGPYTQGAHLADAMLVHHLVLCRTHEALQALRHLPRGHYCPELMLYWQMAKAGAEYVPMVGYVWNKSPTGMHAWPATTISQMRAALWCKDHP